METASCIFCSIARHESPATIVHEDGEWIAIRDIRPEAPTHVLVMPKRHVEKLSDIAGDTAMIAELFASSLSVAKKLGIEDAFKLVVNNGKDAGQIVPHLHVHLLSHKKEKSET